MMKKKSLPRFLLFHCFMILATFLISSSAYTVHAQGPRASGPLVKREERRPVVSTEYGEISAVRLSDAVNGSYLLHFFTLEPNSLFLPVILNADMVFYVHTGSGKLSWTEEDELKHIDLKRGDVYRLLQGTLFFIHCDSVAETERQRLRIHAIFANSNDDLQEPATGPYSSIQDMVLGFDKKVLQATFKVSEEAIDELLDGNKPPAIVHVDPGWEINAQLITRGLLESRSYNILDLNKKKKKEKEKEKEKEYKRLFNLLKEKKDFENCNGWITAVTRKKSTALKGSDIGLFVVNLTAGSMMGPHWNSMAAEILVVLEGRGMIRVVCPSISKATVCRNVRFEVEKGDVFVVPRFHPMAQIAFNNGTFVFMGFSMMTERNRAQFLAGQASVLRMLRKDVLAMSFNITNTTVDELLAPRDDAVIMGCISCAEEEFRVMEEEMGEEGEEGGEREEEGEKEREEDEESEREEEEREGGGGTEEQEREGGGGGGGEGEPRGPELRRENHDDDEWGRRMAKNKKRRTV